MPKRALLLALLALGLYAAPGRAYTALSVGGAGACALRADGAVVCWGASYDGATSPPPGQFAAISSGAFNSCGVRLADRSIACWGLYAPYWMPQLPTGPIAAVGIGVFHMCVVVADDGHVACVGGHSGPPGEEQTGEADPPPGAFKAVTAGWSHTCAIRLDDTVACWGEQTWYGKTDPPPGTFAQIAAGQEHTCGLRLGGAVVCWGFDREGQIDAPPGAFTQVSAGTSHSCALRTDGAAACWGDDRYGESDPPPGHFTSVGAGHLFSCGLRPDGSIVCWGANDLGQSTPPPETPPDTTPPRVRCSADPAVLWPPDRRLAPVAVRVTVEDAGSSPAGFELRAVASDQPDGRDAPHSGDLQGWTIGAADVAGLLRAERRGGAARRYALIYRGFDRAGNAADCTATVVVPARAPAAGF
jgi:alpha-tubulin suppressor-like RCC1 family protein